MIEMNTESMAANQEDKVNVETDAAYNNRPNLGSRQLLNHLAW